MERIIKPAKITIWIMPASRYLGWRYWPTAYFNIYIKRSLKRSRRGSGAAEKRGVSRFAMMYANMPVPARGIKTEKITAGIFRI